MIAKLFRYHYFKKNIAFALFTGALGTFSFSPYNIWPAAIISFSGLLIVISMNTNWKKVTYFSFIWGVSFFSTGITWIYISISYNQQTNFLINILLMVILIIYLAIYPTIFSIILIKIYPHYNLYSMTIGASTLWLILENIRGSLFTGFPWLQFGYTQIDGPMQGLAPILGVEGITFLLTFISGCLSYSCITKKLFPLLMMIIIVLILCPLKMVRWYYLQPKKTIEIALIQPCINHFIQLNDIKIKESILNIYYDLTLSLIEKAKIIVWPETAYPMYEITKIIDLIKLDEYLRNKKTIVITGIIDARPTNNGYNFYNSIIVLGSNQPYSYFNNNRYNKYHLVPFGETIILNKIFKLFLQYINLPISSLQPGDYFQSQLIINDFKITATICYEIIFGNRLRCNTNWDTDFLLNISNDAWFGDSIGPWQHFQMARMRALELGKPLLRCSNNGITAIINPDGTLQEQLPQFTNKILQTIVTPTIGLTPYAKYGSYPLYFILVTSCCITIFSKWNINKKH